MFDVVFFNQTSCWVVRPSHLRWVGDSIAFKNYNKNEADGLCEGINSVGLTEEQWLLSVNSSVGMTK